MDSKYAHFIIFFDGGCSFCNWSVRLSIKNDKRGIFRYARLDGKIAQELLLESEYTDPSTVILLRPDKTKLHRSRAVFAICEQLGGGWRILSLGKYFPVVITDAVYRLFARWRHLIVRDRYSCNFNSDDKRDLFLD